MRHSGQLKQDSKELSPRSLERLLLRLKLFLRLKILSTIWWNFLTCLNLFRINSMIWFVTIHMILKHAQTCSDSIWYGLLWFHMMWIVNIAKTIMKMQGQKGNWKDDIKSYSLDCFEQVERSKMKILETVLELPAIQILPIYLKIWPNQPNLQCCLAGSS